MCKAPCPKRAPKANMGHVAERTCPPATFKNCTSVGLMPFQPKNQSSTSAQQFQAFASNIENARADGNGHEALPVGARHPAQNGHQKRIWDTLPNALALPQPSKTVPRLVFCLSSPETKAKPQHSNCRQMRITTRTQERTVTDTKLCP